MFEVSEGGISMTTTRIAALALAGIIGPLWFTALVILQGVFQPDYSHVAMPISALAAWPWGWMQNLNFFVSGPLTAAFAFGLNQGVQPTRCGVIGFSLLVLSGVGLVVAGIFPWHMVNGVPTETPMHVVGAVMTFASLALGLIVFSRRMAADARWRDLAGYMLATGIVVLLLFITVGGFAIDDGAPLHPWAGALQRVICVVWFSCQIVLALRLRAVGAAPSSRPAPLP
jgi:hypothetical membrane protein